MLQPTIDHIDSYCLPILSQQINKCSMCERHSECPGDLCKQPKGKLVRIADIAERPNCTYFAWPAPGRTATLLLTSTHTTIYHYYTVNKADLQAYLCVDTDNGNVYLIPEDAQVVQVFVETCETFLEA